MAGQSWAAYDLQCSDMTSLIGNSVAGMVFDAAKALDRVTITVYQSAAGEGILSWLTDSVDRLITSLGNAIYFPYLAPVVILGAIWLAWQGLIRKRATRTIEGTIWMVIACAAAIWLIGRPADFTGLGKTVSDGITQTLNVAFAGLPAPAQSNCVPVGNNDPQVQDGQLQLHRRLVDRGPERQRAVDRAGLQAVAGRRVRHHRLHHRQGRQADRGQHTTAASCSGPRPSRPTRNRRPTLITAKQDAYAGIAASIKQNDPAVYSLFQGNQYPTRLEIAFAALFAALVAGVLVLLIAITLIILKLGFLLLLVAGPFFLIVGTHPGFGRVVALRWFEMLVGVLLKQAAIALVLSVLLYAYSLIMGTSDATLPWALKILMIALVTVAVFIYRKPFVHLFSAVGYGVVGSRERGRHRTGPGGQRGPAEHGGRGHRRRARVRRLPGRPLGPAQPGPGGRRGRVGRDGGWRGRGGRARRPVRPPGPARPGPAPTRRARPAARPSPRTPTRCPARPGWPPGAAPGPPRRRQQPSRRAAAGPAGPGRHRPAPGLRLVPVRCRGHRYRPVPGQRAAPVSGQPRPAPASSSPLAERGQRAAGPAARGVLVAAALARRGAAATRRRPPPAPPERRRPGRPAARPGLGHPGPVVRHGPVPGTPARSLAPQPGRPAVRPHRPPRRPPSRRARRRRGSAPRPGAGRRSAPRARRAALTPGRPPAQRAVPAQPVGRRAAPRRPEPAHRAGHRRPASPRRSPGTAATAAPDSPPGPFWLRPVRRKK